MDRGYVHGLWLTYKQAQAIGPQVRRGETGTQVSRFGQFEHEDAATGETGTGSYLRTIERPNLAERVDRAEEVPRRVGVPIHHDSDQAFYRPSTGMVHMPDPDLFRPTGDASATQAYYSVAFHEAGHATGHASRLAWHLKGRFGDAA